LQVSTQNQHGTLAEATDIVELRSRWLDYGYLWTEESTSEPVPIWLLKVEELPGREQK